MKKSNYIPLDVEKEEYFESKLKKMQIDFCNKRSLDSIDKNENNNINENLIGINDDSNINIMLKTNNNLKNTKSEFDLIQNTLDYNSHVINALTKTYVTESEITYCKVSLWNNLYILSKNADKFMESRNLLKIKRNLQNNPITVYKGHNKNRRSSNNNKLNIKNISNLTIIIDKSILNFY